MAQPPSLPELLDRTAVFLHRSPLERDGGATGADSGGDRDTAVLDKRILIVDDDVRNVFALTSALEQHGIDVLYAESGEGGLETLRREADIDLVLMDVMMPGMDGYTAMREIRRCRRSGPPGDRADGQGDAGRPGQQPDGRGVGLRHQARRRGAALSVIRHRAV